MGVRWGVRLERSSRKEEVVEEMDVRGTRVSLVMPARRPRWVGVVRRFLKASRRSCEAG